MATKALCSIGIGLNSFPESENVFKSSINTVVSKKMGEIKILGELSLRG